MRELSWPAHMPFSTVGQPIGMNGSGIGPPKGPIAAAAAAVIILGGGLFGLVALGSPPAVGVPASVAVSTATPPAEGTQAAHAAPPASVQSQPPASPPASAQSQPPASPPSGSSPALAVIAPERPVVVLGPAPAASEQAAPASEPADSKDPGDG